MIMTLQRTEQTADLTFGTLALDGEPECLTLEDAVRAAGEKVFGQTAIPAGRYRVVVDYSPRFGRAMPHVLDVPGFLGIRIHTGNAVSDTQGCILVGRERSGELLLRSREAYRPLLSKLVEVMERHEEIWLDVLNAKEVA